MVSRISSINSIILKKSLDVLKIIIHSWNSNGAPCFDWSFGLSFGGRKPPKRRTNRFPGLHKNFLIIQVVKLQIFFPFSPRNLEKMIQFDDCAYSSDGLVQLNHHLLGGSSHLETPFISHFHSHLEGVQSNPILRGQQRSPWLLTTYIHWEPILQVVLIVPSLGEVGPMERKS